MHGPYEFYNAERHRLAAKVVDARFVVCISDFARSQLMTLVPEEHWSKLRVVHCGLNPDEFRPVDEPPPSDGSIEVLSIARLDHEKGQTVLLEAIARLARQGVPVRAVIAGTGPKEEELERLAAQLGIGDRVSFPGAVGQDEIRRRYAAASIFCLPSFAEGLPGVLIEAMAMAVPVVAARIMGTPELVEEGVSGLLVPPARADLLADALSELAADPDLRRRMGAAGRRKVQNEFDIRTSAEQLEALFVEMGLPGARPRAEPATAAAPAA
jgi:glycosyltransferase involved in cell wall biosynthesis